VSTISLDIGLRTRALHHVRNEMSLVSVIRVRNVRGRMSLMSVIELVCRLQPSLEATASGA
jgi:hypothetical protein